MAQLTPGSYQLMAKATGFTDVTIKSVDLLVDSPATINIKFEKVGGVSETIQVEAAAVQINTVDASLGNAISTQAIMELPMYARNVRACLRSSRASRVSAPLEPVPLTTAMAR